MSKSPLISVIIPCYNQGQYVDEAVDSVLNQTYKNIEIVIVNDGSTDDFTNRHLSNYKKPHTQVITTTNQGLSAARNNAIKAAKGKYILPLDADDKIHPTYIEKAVDYIEKNPEYGIVYCEAEMFGDKTGKWNLPEFSLDKILLQNMIFCSALYRREDWEKVGGYSSELGTGREDYDLWLSFLELGRKVYRIPEILFFYRIRSDSMTREWKKDDVIKSFQKLYERHKKLYEENIGKILYSFSNLMYEVSVDEEDRRRIKETHNNLLEDLSTLSQKVDYLEKIANRKIVKLVLSTDNSLKKYFKKLKNVIRK